MKRRTIATIACLAFAARRGLSAQSGVRQADARLSVTSAADSGETEWHGWASAALGVAAGRAYQGVGGDLALWVTRNDWAFAVRRAATTGLFEDTNNTYDTSLLIGRRIHTPKYLTVVAGVGAGVGTASSASGSPGNEPTAAIGVQAMLNLYVIAIGLDGFAARGATRHFAGIGVTLALGGFRSP
jgi:hypothetical protein